MKNWKRATAALTAGVMAMTLASCSKEEDVEIPYTVDEVLEMYAEDTSIDDVLKNNDRILILEEDEEEDKSTLLDAVNKLENYIKIVDAIEPLELEINSQEDEEKTHLIEDMEIEDIEILIESYKAGEIPSEDAEVTRQTLKAIQEQYKTWVVLNGKIIAEEALKRSIKAIACDISNRGLLYYQKSTYNDCSISAKNYSDKSFTLGIVSVESPDESSSTKGDNYQITYDTDKTPSFALDKLYKIQENRDSYEYSEISILCKEAIDSLKCLAASDIVEKYDNITSKEKISEVKQKILSKGNQTETN